MDIKLKEINIRNIEKMDNDGIKFIGMKQDLISTLFLNAKSIGLTDKSSKHYNVREIIKGIKTDNRKPFILFDKEECVGIVEIEIKDSYDSIFMKDSSEFAYIWSIFIIESKRGRGYAKEVIRQLKERYKVLLLDSWYRKEDEFYNKLGFQRIRSTFTLI